MTDFNGVLRLEIQKARSDVFVWGISSWSGYRFGGPADSATSGVEWLNILGSSHDISIQRGLKRDGVTLSLEAGTLNATVFDAAIDPNTNPYFKPGTPMRLMYESALGDVPVFTGALRRVQVTYRGNVPRVSLSAVDRTTDLANISRSGVVSGTFQERVADLLGKHGYPFTAAGSTPLTQNAFDSSLLEHLTVAATSAQGAFFVDKGNEVKAYGKDALAASGAPTLWFTDRKLPGTAMRVNLITNPSFEVNVAGWTSARGFLARVESDAVSGDYVGRFTADGNAGGNYVHVFPRPDVTAGNVYTGSAYLKAGTGTLGLRLDFVWFNASAGVISTSSPAYTTVGTDWVRLSHTATAPAGATSVQIRILANATMAAGATFDVDAALMEANAGLGQYFDGDSLMGTWFGTPHNSVTFWRLDKGVEYTDIEVAYDSASLVNDLMVENLTYGLNEEMEPQSIHTKFGPFRNVTSIATHGAHTENVVTNLPNAVAINDYADNVLNDNDAPELRVDSVRFNAGNREDIAAGIEVFDSVNVEYSNDQIHIGDDFRVLGLVHTITAGTDSHKWMVDVDLISEIGGSN